MIAMSQGSSYGESYGSSPESGPMQNVCMGSRYSSIEERTSSTEAKDDLTIHDVGSAGHMTADAMLMPEEPRNNMNCRRDLCSGASRVAGAPPPPLQLHNGAIA